ncbi:MAG TPA: RecX family transcriptional regulator [Paracoccaceae bacterium]|nr:RecX family transcriptional regulator [Paracoccaceae bacterium]
MCDLALSYVARYATSGARLERYLKRKLRESGWANEECPPDVAALVETYAGLGYVDDRGFAQARSSSLLRRGYGARRVDQALGQDGIAPEIRSAVAASESQLRHAALAMASKRRFGPFGNEPPERERREKQLSAMLRAGHSLDFAREMVNAASTEHAEEWAHELDDEQHDNQAGDHS